MIISAPSRDATRQDRDLLLVTVILALAVGWGVDHWRQEINHQETRFLYLRTEDSRQHLKSILREDGYKFGVDEHGFVSIQSPKDLLNSSSRAPNPPKP